MSLGSRVYYECPICGSKLYFCSFEGKFDRAATRLIVGGGYCTGRNTVHYVRFPLNFITRLYLKRDWPSGYHKIKRMKKRKERKIRAI